MIRFDPTIPLADADRAARAIGCALVPDGRGGAVIARRAARRTPEELFILLAAAFHRALRADRAAVAAEIAAARPGPPPAMRPLPEAP
jgi:hypothetical protein